MKKILYFCGFSFLAFVALFVFRPLQYFFPVSSDSMEPTFPVGEMIYTNPFSTAVPGDVIWFECKDKTRGDIWCGMTYGKDQSQKSLYHRYVRFDEKRQCMWIIGDNKKYDWTDDAYCYPPDDIIIHGVVRLLPF